MVHCMPNTVHFAIFISKKLLYVEIGCFYEDVYVLIPGVMSALRRAGCVKLANRRA